MPITPLTVTTPAGPFPAALPVGAGSLDITMAAADATNGNSFPLTASEILIVSNPDSSAHTFTITSTTDPNGRTGDITAYSVAAGAVSAFSFRGATVGWQQTDGAVHLTTSSALLKFGVLKPVK